MAEQESQQQTQKRQVAYKLSIKNLLDGQYVREEGWQPNYIDFNGNKVSRTNIIGTVVLKNDENNIVLDDGTGKISLRIFEGNTFFEEVDVGDIVIVIGRPREFGSERYILPETLKKIEDPAWVKVRSYELKGNNSSDEEKEEVPEEEIKESEITSSEDPSEKLFNLIKELDKGEGIDIEEIIKESNNSEAEVLIKKLLEKGEIFEVGPGKLKVLE